jgi:uncharacterized protein
MTKHPRYHFSRWFSLASVLMLLTPAALCAFTQPSLSISSGNQTGAAYAVANAITKIFNRKCGEYGMRLAAVPSQGSVADIDSVLEGTAAFGIAQSAILQQAALALGPWQGKVGKGGKELRAVLSLHAESLTVVAAQDRSIRKLADLKGKRVNIGEPGSGDYQYASVLMELAGFAPSDLTLTTYPVSLASEALQKNEIDAYLYLVGHPNLSVLEASSGERKVSLLPMGAPLIAKLTARAPLFDPERIPTTFYPGLVENGEITTVGLQAILFTRADTDEDTVYRLVKEVLANFALFQRQHPVLDGLTPRAVTEVTVLPLHPGAARYFREAGIGG